MSLARRASTRPRASGTRRVLSALLRLGMGAGLLLVFVGGSLLAFVLYANLPAGRRVLAIGLERVLKTTFEGGFGIAAVEHISLKELRARGFTVHDPDGHLVLSVSALSVNVDLADILRKVLFGRERVTLRFDHARIERAEVYLLPGAHNVPTIVDAFTPTPTPPGTASRSCPSRRTLPGPPLPTDQGTAPACLVSHEGSARWEEFPLAVGVGGRVVKRHAGACA